MTLVDVDGRSRPSFSLAISGGGVGAIILAGWHLENADHEQRIGSDWSFAPVLDLAGQRETIAFCSSDNRFVQSLLARKDDFSLPPTATFELEVLDDPTSRPIGELLLSRLVDSEISNGIWQSLAEKPLGKQPLSLGHDLELGSPLEAADVTAVDLSVLSLPSRRTDRHAPVYFGSRWVRIFGVGPSVVSIYSSPPAGNWSPKVRSPHHAIASRSPEWFELRVAACKSNIASPPFDLAERVSRFVADLDRHQMYYLNAWPLELELWEQRVFRSLSARASADMDEVEAIEKDLGHLAEYLIACRIANRNLAMRPRVSRLVARSGLTQSIATSSELTEASLDANRDRLRNAIGLMSAASSAASAQIAAQQRRVSERTQYLVTLVTAIFLVPSLVIGTFGANLRELSPDSFGTLPQLVTWILVGLGLSWAAMSIATRRQVVPGPLLATCGWSMGLSGLLCFSAWLAGVPYIFWASAASVLVSGLAIAAYQSSGRQAHHGRASGATTEVEVQ